MFHVGQEVLCINAKPFPTNILGMCGLVEGTSFTVRKTCIHPNGTAQIYLNEIIRRSGYVFGTHYDELPYRASRFKPVIKKTDGYQYIYSNAAFSKRRCMMKSFKTYKMLRNNVSCDIVELSYADIIKLLFGYEIQVWPRIFVRRE